MKREYIVEVIDEWNFWPYWWDEFPEMHEHDEPERMTDSFSIIVTGKDENDVIEKLQNSKRCRFRMVEDGSMSNNLIGCKIGKIMLND